MPLVRGESRRLPNDDQALIATWTCKTALVSLLLSSNEARLGVIDAESPPDLPSGYAITLAQTRLLVQGVRFIEPALQVELTTDRGLLDIWPTTDTFLWPTADVSHEESLIAPAGGL
jgi:hypothetical protein